jgi:hypothetical protein
MSDLYELLVENESELRINLGLAGFARTRTYPFPDKELKRGPDIFFRLLLCPDKTRQH